MHPTNPLPLLWTLATTHRGAHSRVRRWLPAVIVSGILWAPTVGATATRGVEIPELGSKRRVVLSDMRRAGLQLLDGSGDVLEFDGGPTGLSEAEGTRFHFDGVKLHAVTVDLSESQSEARAHRLFRAVRDRLLVTYGAPWKDSLRDADAATVGSLTTTWSDTRAKILLRAATDGSVRLSITPHGLRVRARAAAEQTGEREAWDPGLFGSASTRAKAAAEDLLYELGNQGFLANGAKRKGSPIGVRLRRVRVAREVEGVDKGLILSRFIVFARGHWEVAMAPNRRRADVDLDVTVERSDRGSGYTMRVVARALNGKMRGRVLYEASRWL